MESKSWYKEQEDKAREAFIREPAELSMSISRNESLKIDEKSGILAQMQKTKEFILSERNKKVEHSFSNPLTFDECYPPSEVESILKLSESHIQIKVRRTGCVGSARRLHYLYYKYKFIMEGLKHYIGVKEIDGVAMTLGDYNEYKGWKIPPEEDPDTEGYLVIYPDGYKSWSPKKAFEDAYRETTEGCMTFGLAIEALKKGKKVARIGWNGKGMWLRYYHPFIDSEFPMSENEPCEGTPIEWIGMKTVDNSFVPWLASQTDMLSEDWIIVD